MTTLEELLLSRASCQLPSRARSVSGAEGSFIRILGIVSQRPRLVGGPDKQPRQIQRHTRHDRAQCYTDRRIANKGTSRRLRPRSRSRSRIQLSNQQHDLPIQRQQQYISIKQSVSPQGSSCLSTLHTNNHRAQLRHVIARRLQGPVQPETSTVA